MAMQRWLPEQVTVHMGKPDEAARDITVPFAEYLKNTASAEIDPAFPEKTIRQRVYLMLQFALNRIGGRFYRARGYAFDVTSLPKYDRKFNAHGRTFQNINGIVAEALNSLSGTPLHGAERVAGGESPASAGAQAYPGYPLELGSTGAAVRNVQLELNRVAGNYPAIPLVAEPDGVFGKDTEEAVRRFQQIFCLEPDGVVGRDTWYQLRHVYGGIRRFSGLLFDGQSVQAGRAFAGTMKEGSMGGEVWEAQYHINVVAYFYPEVPGVAIDRYYGPKTAEAVRAFQKLSSLVQDGVVGQNTWHSMGLSCGSIMGCVNGCLPSDYAQNTAAPYPGYVLRKGMENADVEKLRKYLAGISQYYGTIQQVQAKGAFDEPVAEAVRELQIQNGLAVTGEVGEETWNLVARLYDTR